MKSPSRVRKQWKIENKSMPLVFEEKFFRREISCLQSVNKEGYQMRLVCDYSQQKVGRMLASTELFYTFCVNYELYLWVNDISVLNWLSVYCYVFGELKWLDNFTANYLPMSDIFRNLLGTSDIIRKLSGTSNIFRMLRNEWHTCYIFRNL